MSVSLYIHAVPEELRDRVAERATADQQSINSLLLDLIGREMHLIGREMQLPTLDDRLDGLDDLSRISDLSTGEIVAVIRRSRESS